MTYSELREKYKNFYYLGYNAEVNGRQISVTYHFETEGLASFSPEWKFTAPDTGTDINDPILSGMLFSLGMVELVSYWKIACPPNVFIKCGSLDDFQTEWWKKLYFAGLGEFFYVNGITDADKDSFMTIISEKTSEKISAPSGSKKLDGVLIPIGGGKDSAVTIDMLSSIPRRGCYIINPRGATLETADIGGFDDEHRLTVSRTLDKNMLELNKSGNFLNGHTPFSAIVAFSSLISAYLNGYKYIALSNEASANENTVDNAGIGNGVNHQYSKSFEFEKDFYEYERRYINSGIHYFSLLRRLSEYQIAEYFAKITQYHGIFKSCNAGSKQNIWCCGCAKCLFVYLILSPFLSPSELENIFGENLADKSSLMEDFKKLIGEIPEKPFECVGSRDEVNTAVCEAVKKYEGGRLPALFEYYVNTPLYQKYKDRENPYKNYSGSENLIPEELQIFARGGKK